MFDSGSTQLNFLIFCKSWQNLKCATLFNQEIFQTLMNEYFFDSMFALFQIYEPLTVYNF